MSKQAEADLILKLYDLRREPVMRAAREWYFREFHPQTFDELKQILLGEHSGHLRMLLSYWDMAAGLVKHGAIAPELFNDVNGEHLAVYAKIEPFVAEWRSGGFGKTFMSNVEHVINTTPGCPERFAEVKERMKRMMAALRTQKWETKT